MRCFNNVFALAINSSNVVSVVTSYLPSNWLVVLRPVAPHLRHSDKQFLSPKNCFCICEVFVHCVIAVCAAMVGCYTCTWLYMYVSSSVYTGLVCADCLLRGSDRCVQCTPKNVFRSHISWHFVNHHWYIHTCIGNRCIGRWRHRCTGMLRRRYCDCEFIMTRRRAPNVHTVTAECRRNVPWIVRVNRKVHTDVDLLAAFAK